MKELSGELRGLIHTQDRSEEALERARARPPSLRADVASAPRGGAHGGVAQGGARRTRGRGVVGSRLSGLRVRLSHHELRPLP